MKYVFLITVLIIGCSPPRFPNPDQLTPSGIGVSGANLSQAELISIDERVEATRQCLEQVATEPTGDCPATGKRVTGTVSRIHVENTCWIKVSGYDKPQRGSVEKGVARVGRDTRSVQHEGSVLLLSGFHSHNKCAPTILCEHAGPKPFPWKCEPP